MKPGSQLVLESDVRILARLRVGAEETNALVGLQPDVVRELANNAFEFWNVQECGAAGRSRRPYAELRDHGRAGAPP